MNHYHGKVLFYRDDPEFVESLPNRRDFIDSTKEQQLELLVASGKNVPFFPIDHLDLTIAGHYYPMLIGVSLGGVKVAVLIEGIRPCFDVRVPDGEDPKSFVEKLCAETRTSLIERDGQRARPSVGAQLVRQKPFLYYQAQCCDWVRLSFDNTFEYSHALKFVTGRKLSTANDDQGNYFRKVAREYRWRLCDWCVIRGVRLSANLCKEPVRYTWRCSADGFANMPADKAARIGRDWSIIGAWDTETYNSRGGMPEVMDLETSEVRMEADVFYWHWNATPFLCVNFTTIPTQPLSDCLVILCANQAEIIAGKARLLERISPEFYTAFNDGFYDWPFEIRRAERLNNGNLLSFLVSSMSVLKDPRITGRAGVRSINIKVSADMQTNYEYPHTPGIICFDTRTIFRQLYPTDEESSLNYFLSLNKLGSKDEMDYGLMAQVFRSLGCRSWEAAEADESARWALPMAAKIIHYCNVDARRCQELLVIRSILSDRRETANLALITMRDSLYWAGGLKVRNLVMSIGCREPWNLAFPTHSHDGERHVKNPGAYVVPPRKGLYRDHSREKQGRGERDENRNDRPCAVLDFQSLYPSLIMTYNLSPEKLVISETQATEMMASGQRLLEIDFRRGVDGVSEDEKTRVHGWFVQHQPETFEDMGLYPSILRDLFEQRRALKKKMNYWAGPLDVLREVKIPAGATIDRSEVAQYLATEIERQTERYQQTAKPYYQQQVDMLRGAEKFLAVEWSPDWDWNRLLEEVSFNKKYYEVKQGALKIFMNTFYGETGNSISPFFIAHVSGAITTLGRKNIMMVKDHAESRGFDVKYGDTDSLHASPPDEYFTAVDAAYESGQMTRAEYWTAMIEISYEVLNRYRAEVNDLLWRDNGTHFLCMNYEEVLFPYAFVGKKKYFGVIHKDLVDLRICQPDCTLEVFMNSGSLLIKGLEMKKRGSSELVKVVCFEIIKEALCLGSRDSLRAIVERKLPEIATRSWNPQIFIRSAAYKKSQTGGPGNQVVIRFVERMTEIERRFPQLGLKAPKLGERFNYIVARKYPWTYDLRGRKEDLKVGDKLERFEAIGHAEYEKVLAEYYGCGPVEADVDYYVTGEIVGQFSRLITYHPDYDHFFGLSDENYKQADDAARKSAVAALINLYKQHCTINYRPKAKICKKIYKSATQSMCRALTEAGAPDVIADLSDAFADRAINDVSFAEPRARADLRMKIREIAEKLACRKARSMIDSFAGHANNRQEIGSLDYNLRLAHNAYFRVRRSENADRIRRIEAELDGILQELERECVDNICILRAVVMRLRESVDRSGNMPTAECLEDDYTGEIDEDDLVNKFNISKKTSAELYAVIEDIYWRMVAGLYSQKCCALTEDDLQSLDERKRGIVTMPTVKFGNSAIPGNRNLGAYSREQLNAYHASRSLNGLKNYELSTHQVSRIFEKCEL